MRRIFSLLAVGALTAALALPALAAGPSGTTTTGTNPTQRAHAHWFAGSVTQVGDSTLTIGVLWTGPHDGSLNGQSVTVAVDSNTVIVSGKNRTPVPLSSLQSGDLVAVAATGTDLSSLTAKRIHVYCNCHWIGGTIGSLGTTSFTVQVTRTGPYDTVLNGTTVTMNINSSTVYVLGRNKTPIAFSDLKTGQAVGVVFSADGFFKAPGFDPTTATFTAKRVHVWRAHQAPPASTDSGSAASTTA
jgi:hypothetical protein